MASIDDDEEDDDEEEELELEFGVDDGTFVIMSKFVAGLLDVSMPIDFRLDSCDDGDW